AQPACAAADIIVIEDASAKEVCPEDGVVVVVTARDLAQRGSAAISFVPSRAPAALPESAGKLRDAAEHRATDPGGAVSIAIAYAISGPHRPWHQQRQYSREARGLPPYRRQQPKVRTPAPSKTQPEQKAAAAPAAPAGK